MQSVRPGGQSSTKRTASTGTSPRIRALADDLRPDETVSRIAEGTYNGDAGLLVLTSTRLFFRPDGRRATDRLDVTLHRLNAVHWSPGVAGGTVGVVTADGTREVRRLEGADGAGFVDEVRTAWAQALAAAPLALPRAERAGDAARERTGDGARKRVGDAARTFAADTVVLPRAVEQAAAGGDTRRARTTPRGVSATPETADAHVAPGTAEPDTAVAAQTHAGPRNGRRVRNTHRRAAGSRAHDTTPSGRTSRRRTLGWIRRPLIAVAAGIVGVLGALAFLNVLGDGMNGVDGADRPTPSQVAAPAPATSTAQPPAADLPAGPTVTVTRVVDGDTIEVTGAADGPVQVLGIDAAELDGDGCFARESAFFASRALAGEEVTLVSDPDQPATDRSGRTLAYLRLADGTDYSVRAVTAGMATYYVTSGTLAHAPELEAAQDSAKADGMGLWNPPCNGNIDDPPGSTPPRTALARAGVPGVAGPDGARLVRARTYCATEGEEGVLIDGTAMVCTGPDSDRRWRPAG